jgi:ribosome-associated protein
MATDTVPDAPTTALLRNLIAALEDKKADHLKVLHVGGVSDITDYLVLATGNIEPHLRALRIEAEKVLDAAKARIAGMEQGGFGSGWTVVDAYQIMVHFFTAEQRENYALEKLWKDAPEVDLKTLVAKPAPTPKPKAARPKAAKGKAAGTGKKPAAKKSGATKTAKKPAAKAPASRKKKPAAK